MTATPTQSDFDDDNECWDCGGEGFVYMRLDEIGCIDPEGGCDLCEWHCPVCRPRKGQAPEWHCIRAARFGLPHIRDRIWIIAYPSRTRRERLVKDDGLSVAAQTPLTKHGDTSIGGWLEMVRDCIGIRTGDGVPLMVERARLKALGNAVVPQIPELIGKAILESRTAAIPADWSER